MVKNTQIPGCRNGYSAPVVRLLEISLTDILCGSFTAPDLTEEQDPFTWE